MSCEDMIICIETLLLLLLYLLSERWRCSVALDVSFVVKVKGQSLSSVFRKLQASSHHDNDFALRFRTAESKQKQQHHALGHSFSFA